MKTKLLKSLLAIACLLCSIGIQAHDFEVDGIYYNKISDTEVAVTYYGEYSYNIPEEYKYSGSIVIPESVTYDGHTYQVKKIEPEIFYRLNELTAVFIPNTITYIEYANFVYCPKLESVNIPQSLTQIPLEAFAYCPKITSITIPEGIERIEGAFSGLGITSIEIPSSVKVMNYAFRDNNSLTEIVCKAEIAPTVTDCFNNIDKSIAVYVPLSGILTYQTNDFWKEFTNITPIPNTEVAVGQIFTIDGIHYKVLPQSGEVAVTHLGEAGDNDLSKEYQYSGSVVIPESITYYGDLTYSVTSIDDYAFAFSTNMTEVFIPNSVRSIGQYAFRETGKITSLNIPNSVTSIEDYTFAFCMISSINLPNSIKSIGQYAFCSNITLKELTIDAITPPTVNRFTFVDLVNPLVVYVPAESVEAYQKAEYWSEFTNIQEITIPDVIATSLTLDNEVLEMYIGDAVQLTATVLPDNTTNKVVTWTSSDNEVATVDENGNITAVSIGSATISATTTDGSNLTTTCEVTVVQKMVKLTMQNSYYNNVIFFLLPGTEQKIQIVNIDPMFVLNTVMFNDENVTEQLVDGVYTTPALEEDAVINISYDIPTAEDTPMHNSRIKAYGHRGDVVVTGCERGESIAIYDVDGILLRTIFATSDAMRIAMPTGAVYVVKVADAAVKVAL